MSRPSRDQLIGAAAIVAGVVMIAGAAILGFGALVATLLISAGILSMALGSQRVSHLSAGWAIGTFLGVGLGIVSVYLSLVPEEQPDEHAQPSAPSPRTAPTQSKATGGWGPERATFSTNSPPAYVTFNSITDNPNYGDERNFVLTKPTASTHPGGFTNEQFVQAEGEYLVRALISNSATKSGLVAKGTRIIGSVPNETSDAHSVQVTIGSTNARPSEVWDGVRFHGPRRFNIGYVPGSASLITSIRPKGTPISDKMFTGAGVSIGTTAKGVIPTDPGQRSSAIVTFRVRTHEVVVPQFEVEAESRPHRDGDATGGWRQITEVNAGESVDVRFIYRNTGQVVQNNVVVKTQLPSTVRYERGTSRLTNSSNPDGMSLSDATVGAKGINLGSYSPPANAQMTLAIRVPTDVACGSQEQHVRFTAYTDNGSKSSSAPLMIYRAC